MKRKVVSLVEEVNTIFLDKLNRLCVCLSLKKCQKNHENNIFEGLDITSLQSDYAKKDIKLSLWSNYDWQMEPNHTYSSTPSFMFEFSRVLLFILEKTTWENIIYRIIRLNSQMLRLTFECWNSNVPCRNWIQIRTLYIHTSFNLHARLNISFRYTCSQPCHWKLRDIRYFLKIPLTKQLFINHGKWLLYDALFVCP